MRQEPRWNGRALVMVRDSGFGINFWGGCAMREKGQLCFACCGIVASLRLLHEDWNVVHLKYATITDGTDLSRIEDFYLASTFIEIVVQGDTVAIVLYLAAGCPEPQVDGITSFEYVAESADMDASHGRIVASLG